MAKKKRTKWIIGLSSVAAFTGFVGLLNKTDSASSNNAAAYENESTQIMPNNQNPFSEDNQNNGSSNTWSGDYDGDASEDRRQQLLQ
ncbi:MAG: hypothetical protein ABF649_17275 [Bacillus sp. (in: firmicutes)]